MRRAAAASVSSETRSSGRASGFCDIVVFQTAESSVFYPILGQFVRKLTHCLPSRVLAAAPCPQVDTSPGLVRVPSGSERRPSILAAPPRIKEPTNILDAPRGD